MPVLELGLRRADPGVGRDPAATWPRARRLPAAARHRARPRAPVAVLRAEPGRGGAGGRALHGGSPGRCRRSRRCSPTGCGRGATRCASLDRGLVDEFVAGERYTVADIALYAYVHCAADAGADPREYAAHRRLAGARRGDAGVRERPRADRGGRMADRGPAAEPSIVHGSNGRRGALGVALAVLGFALAGTAQAQERGGAELWSRSMRDSGTPRVLARLDGTLDARVGALASSRSRARRCARSCRRWTAWARRRVLPGGITSVVWRQTVDGVPGLRPFAAREPGRSRARAQRARRAASSLWTSRRRRR